MTEHTFTIDSPTGHLCLRISGGETYPAEILKSNAKGERPVKALVDFGGDEAMREFRADGTNTFCRLINAPAKLTVEGLKKEAWNSGQTLVTDIIRLTAERLGHTVNEDGTIEEFQHD